jgi:type I restriction enzyme, S subunit
MVEELEMQKAFKKTEIGEIPCDWEIKLGSDLSERITKGASPRWQGFAYQDYGVLFVTSENVRDGWLDISEPKYLPFSFSEKQKNSQLSNGDILINIVGASIGRACIFNKNIPQILTKLFVYFVPPTT